MFEDKHPSTHPPHPPTTEDDRISWLRLLRSRRVGPRTFHRLMAEHGGAAEALAALPQIAQAAGARGYRPATPEIAAAELHAARAVGAQMLCIGEPGYPSLLAETEDAPPVLWALGNMAVLERSCISFVGARNASSLGLRMARMLARELGEAGFTTVSGLARGVDTAAHAASLETGTIAVLAGGVDVIYPAENTRLAEDILRSGLLISEQPFGLAPLARHFPSRNRIISGLSRMTVVVEAAAKSGSLITARAALDQGREVMAVPGHPFEPRASGCNMLIRDGAALARSGRDVVEAMEAMPDRQFAAQGAPNDARSKAQPKPGHSPAEQVSSHAKPAARSLRETAALHNEILSRLGPSPIAEDQLIRDIAAPAAHLSPTISELELTGRITRHPGGLLSASQHAQDANTPSSTRQSRSRRI